MVAGIQSNHEFTLLLHRYLMSERWISSGFDGGNFIGYHRRRLPIDKTARKKLSMHCCCRLH